MSISAAFAANDSALSAVVSDTVPSRSLAVLEALVEL